MPTPKRYRLAVLNGDGIGPEIVPASVKILDAAIKAAGAPGIEWTELPLGQSAIDTQGAAVPEETLATLDTVDGWLLGPHDSASYPEPHRYALNPSGTIRKHFGLFANIRPAKAFPAATRSSKALTWSLCAKTPKVSTLTGTPTPVRGSSCPPRTWRSCTASSPVPPRRASPTQRSSWPSPGPDS